MTIKFLGSGSAFVRADENFHSNILITDTQEQEVLETSEHTTLNTGEKKTITKHLLIDAGTHINESLYFHGLEATDIHAIFITHNHADHNGGLEYIGFKTYFIPPFGSKKPVLFGMTSVLDTLWNHTLKGNMGSLNEKRVGLQEYFEVLAIKPKQSFNFMNTQFIPVRMTHVVDDIMEVPAYGLKWAADNVKFFFSGDTQFDFWRLMPFWEEADIIFQDCEMAEYPDGVHAQLHQLIKIPEKYKRKMWLYHYSLQDKTYQELEAKVLEAGFAGLVKRSQEFNSKDLYNQLKKNKENN